MTALIYLNENYQGGATRFVKTGQEIRGRTGDVLVFSNSDGEGARDPLAEHAGMPVTQGIKYLATRWIRKRRHIRRASNYWAASSGPEKSFGFRRIEVEPALDVGDGGSEGAKMRALFMNFTPQKRGQLR